LQVPDENCVRLVSPDGYFGGKDQGKALVATMFELLPHNSREILLIGAYKEYAQSVCSRAVLTGFALIFVEMSMRIGLYILDQLTTYLAKTRMAAKPR
jgi:hypothetical protein